ncbi:hypothetical protein RJT34_31060 [Clitoria ternatea]|uniref:Uncharacterized protein n=1 Tax=Clitoria ternatea TaxID=43366 RepID=A0AAN9I389_CLITE
MTPSLREKDTNHVRNELEFIARLFDEFLNLSTTETFLDRFPVMLLLAHLEAVPREALNGLAVPFVFWNLPDLLQCLAALQQPLQGLNSSSTAARQRREQHAG